MLDLALIISIVILTLILLLILFIRSGSHKKELLDKLDYINSQFEERARLGDDISRKAQQENIDKLSLRLIELKDTLNQAFNQHRAQFDERQLTSLKLLQDTLQNTTIELTKQFDRLTDKTNERLKEIGGEVEKRLSEGFEKTTATFSDVLKRLALIDEAQKRITELSTNVISLQQVLNDKRSRGAFGEVQLSALIHNVLPEKTFSLQHTLSNGKRVDCMLFLPKPTGNIAIDAKFPLENYQRMADIQLDITEQQAAAKQFQIDLKKHIQDIAGKYIIPNETSDGAIMFIPAEAIFAEIHAHHPDIVEQAHKSHVWMVSPTTMMAILTTVKAVLKDEATREQVHIIQEHLNGLSKDFVRFQDRMEKLAIHIKQANSDVELVHTSAKKITSRFQKIEKVELESASTLLLDETE